MTRTRTIFWALLLLSGVVILHTLDSQPVPGHMGRAVVCSRRFPFHEHSQAEILEYGLQDVRGLAWDREKNRLFISENNRSLLIDWLNSGAGTGDNAAVQPSFEETEARTMCPEESCGVAAERGLAILDGKLFSAEHGRGQVSVRDLPPARFTKDKDKDEGAGWLLSALPLPGKPELLTEPVGIAAVDRTLFITDAPLRAPTPEAQGPKALASKVPAPKDNSNASAEPPGDSEKAAAQPAGALYVCAIDQCSPEPITASLHHPSGVAAEKAEGPVIVAEGDVNEVRWPVYEKADGKWRETRSLGSVPISGEALPAFLGIALDDSRKMVFAAGPGGLYVFDLDGTLLGRIMFDDPVTGVVTGGNHVYLAVGHSLCALTFDYSVAPNTVIAPLPQTPPNGPVPTVGQPAPKSHRPKPRKRKSQANSRHQSCECDGQKSRS
jgi:hypothetical protein